MPVTGILRSRPRLCEFSRYRKEGLSIGETASKMGIMESTAKLYNRMIRQPDFYIRKSLEYSEENRTKAREMRLAEIKESVESALKKDGVFVSDNTSAGPILLNQVLAELDGSIKIAVFARNRRVLGPISGRSVAYTDPARAVEKLVALFRSEPVVEKALVDYTRHGFNIALAICISNAFRSNPETARALRYALGVKNLFENPKKRI